MSDFEEACKSVAGFHNINNIQAKNWTEKCGNVYCLQTNNLVGYIDYFCNLWLGIRQQKFNGEQAFYSLLQNEYNYVIH